MRAGHAIDDIGEAEPPPVLADLVVAAPEGVRDQHDHEALALAPPKRLRGSGSEVRDGVEGDAAELADLVDLDVVQGHVLPSQPALDDRERLLMPRLVLVRRVVLRIEERVVPIALAVVGRERGPRLPAVVGVPALHERVADVEERSAHPHANIVSTVLDFEQLAFIEKWRQRASRGVVIALDGTRGDIVVTMRAGDLGERLDLRGKDATGAVRKARLAIGDRVTMAIEYTAKDVSAGTGASVSGDLVAPGAVVEGTVSATGDITVVDCGIALLVKGETLPAKVGDVVRFTVADEGRAYLIPTR